MSVEDANIVDFLVVDIDGKILLAITDHLDWQQPLEHIYALQEKLNTYAAFVETGQVWEEASSKARRSIPAGSVPIEVKVFLQYHPPKVFLEFVARAGEVLASLGVTVAHEVRSD